MQRADYIRVTLESRKSLNKADPYGQGAETVLLGY